MEIQRRKIKRIINCVICRIILYVMIPMTTQLGFIVSEIWMYTYMRASYPLNLWSVVTSALPGTLNFFAVMLDPAIHKAIEAIKRYKSYILNVNPWVIGNQNVYTNVASNTLATSFKNTAKKQDALLAPVRVSPIKFQPTQRDSLGGLSAHL